MNKNDPFKTFEKGILVGAVIVFFYMVFSETCKSYKTCTNNSTNQV